MVDEATLGLTPVKSSEIPCTLMLPFKEVPSKVPEKVTSAGAPSSGMLMVKLNLSTLKYAAVDKNQFDLRFFLEEIAVGDDEIGDLPVFDGAKAVGNAEDFRRRQRQRAKSSIRCEARVNRFLRGLDGVR